VAAKAQTEAREKCRGKIRGYSKMTQPAVRYVRRTKRGGTAKQQIFVWVKKQSSEENLRGDRRHFKIK